MLLREANNIRFVEPFSKRLLRLRGEINQDEFEKTRKALRS